MNDGDDNSDDDWEDISDEVEAEDDDENEGRAGRKRRASLVQKAHQADLFNGEGSVAGHIHFDAVFSPAKRGADDDEEDEDNPKSQRASLKSGLELRLSLSLGEASPAAKRSATESSRSEKSESQSNDDVFNDDKGGNEESRESKAGGQVKTQKKLHQEAKAKFEISINLSGDGKEDKQGDRPGFKYKREKKGKGINSQYEHQIGIPGPITAAKSIAKGVSKLASKFKGPGSKKRKAIDGTSPQESKGEEIEMTPMTMSKSAGAQAKK